MEKHRNKLPAFKSGFGVEIGRIIFGGDSSALFS
jgi:hypothetical protein